MSALPGLTKFDISMYDIGIGDDGHNSYLVTVGKNGLQAEAHNYFKASWRQQQPSKSPKCSLPGPNGIWAFTQAFGK